MKMKKWTLILCMFLFMGITTAYAAPAPVHGRHGATSVEHEMGPMFESLGALKGDDFDVVFYSMMIPHHQAAVTMARRVEASKDPQIKKWAEDIIRTQNEEIETMRRAVEKMGGIDPTFYDMMDGDMKPMIEATKSDRDFVEQMIPHHRSAVEMAKLAAGRTENPDLLALSEVILAAQTKEIEEFEAWLKK